jgi:hypothetical protein
MQPTSYRAEKLEGTARKAWLLDLHRGGRCKVQMLWSSAYM